VQKLPFKPSPGGKEKRLKQLQIQCWTCGKFGHKSNDCASKKKSPTSSVSPHITHRIGKRKRGEPLDPLITVEPLQGALKPARLYACSGLDPDLSEPKVGRLTMMVRAGLKGRQRQLKCLFDGGATSCFISRRVVREMGLKSQQMGERQIKLPDGSLSSSTEFVSVALQFDQVPTAVVVPCIVAPLESLEVILGDPWMDKHDVVMSYLARTIFNDN
jgi:hypothetical protein